MTNIAKPLFIELLDKYNIQWVEINENGKECIAYDRLYNSDKILKSMYESEEYILLKEQYGHMVESKMFLNYAMLVIFK